MSEVGTHGEVATHSGTCQTCGREGVGLKANWDRKREAWHFTCVDQFACFDAWRARNVRVASPPASLPGSAPEPGDNT